MEVPPHRWFIVENPNLKWMTTRGTPISGNIHISIYPYIHMLSIYYPYIIHVLSIHYPYIHIYIYLYIHIVIHVFEVNDSFLRIYCYSLQIYGYRYIVVDIFDQIWLVVGPPLWKIGLRQLGWWKQPKISGKIKNGNQTTNQ